VQTAARSSSPTRSRPPRARARSTPARAGGKAAHLLERDPALRLLALDVDARRLERVHQTLQRVGVGAQAKLRAADALLPATWWDGTPFDAILLDAPCSATGVVRRHPDILLHRRASDLAALVDVQARLLDALWPALARGGVLLYATCSILRRENDARSPRSSRARPTRGCSRWTRASATTPATARSASRARTGWTGSSTRGW